MDIYNYLKNNNDILQKMRCPVCYSKVVLTNNHIKCSNTECQILFPIVDGIPVLINESNSVFSINDFINHYNTYYNLPIEKNKKISQIKNIIKPIIHVPKISINLKAKQNYLKLSNLLLKKNKKTLILVVGGSIVGQGMEEILSTKSIEIIESDISFGPRTMLISDAHDIPFNDNTFDAVIAQAVFEHVLNPYRCVEEIYRILKNDGYIYSEVPFMQQVHGGKYDFTRFTHLGHRRLLNKFNEIESGVLCGPGMALAWSIKYFFLSFFKSNILKKIIALFIHYLCFWLKYFDYILINKPCSYNSASGFYFIGSKSYKTFSDKELIKSYRGCT